MFRCVRSTWMIPSNAKLKLSMIEGGRRGALIGAPPLAPPSRGRGRSRAGAAGRARAARASASPDDLRAQDDVAERARQARGQLVAAVDREREDVRRLVDPRCSRFSARISSGADEREPELAGVDPLCGEHAPGERDVPLPRRRRRRSGSRPRRRPSALALARGARLLGVLLVRLDDPLHELVPHDVLVRELDEARSRRSSRGCRAPG